MYSKLKTMYIKNFKNLGEVEIDFTKSPIIALKGNNDAGKSSVIDAFAVAVYNANETHQKDFIKLGTAGFGVKIVLEDGTEITRLKKPNLNYYEVKHPDGRVWSTDKLIRGEGVPSEVEDAMGCTREPETKEFLHIRTYNDQMLFINTPNSVNYKVMYDALKVENISRAIKNGSTEANELKAWLNNASVQRETLLRTLEGIKIMDIEPVVSVRDRIAKSADNAKKMVSISRLMESIDGCNKALGSYKEVYDTGIDTVDSGLVTVLNNAESSIHNINRSKQELDKYSGVETLETINIDKVQRLAYVVQLNEDIKHKVEKENFVSQVDNAQEININSIRSLQCAIEIKNGLVQNQCELEKIGDIGDEIDLHKISRINECVNLISKIGKLKELLIESESIESSSKKVLAELGVSIVTCDKCGNDIILDSSSNEKIIGVGGGCCE